MDRNRRYEDNMSLVKELMMRFGGQEKDGGLEVPSKLVPELTKFCLSGRKIVVVDKPDENTKEVYIDDEATS